MKNYTNNDLGEEAHIERMLLLLKEYKIEIINMRKDYIEISNSLYGEAPPKAKFDKIDFDQEKRQRDILVKTFKKFDLSLEDFARSISQYLDHANVPFTYQMELELRLADFEKELSYTRELMSKQLRYM